MSKSSGRNALLNWTPTGVLPSFSSLSPKDFEETQRALVERFDETLAAAKSTQKEDFSIQISAFQALADAHERLHWFGALLGAGAMQDRRYNTVWCRCHAIEQKAVLRARSSRALRSVMSSIRQNAGWSAGQIESLDRSQLWGREAYEPAAKRMERKSLADKIEKLTEKFKANARESANKTRLSVSNEDAESIVTLPVSVRCRARARAAALGQSGWVFASESSAYIPFMRNCSNRKLREQMYKARARMASEWGDKERDNTQLGLEILKLRAKQAKNSGAHSYAEYCMSANMLSTPQAAEDFLLQLADGAAELAQKERGEALLWLRETEGARALQPWDWRRAFYALGRDRCGDAQNESRIYLPIPETMERACQLVASFLGANSERRRDAEKASGADFIFDWTREGASKPFARIWISPWMDPKKIMNYAANWPIVEPRSGVCGLNLVTLRIDKGHSGMTHDDLSTLLHELGHTAHAMGPRSRWGEKKAGFTETDGIEFHSQFFERLAWDPETMDSLSDREGGFPAELLDRLDGSRGMSGASTLLADIAECLCDLRVHGRSASKRARLWDAFNLARQEVGLAPARGYRRFFNTCFAMTADNSCSDYSYPWTSALAAQAFARWKADRDQLGAQKAGERFGRVVLEPGSSRALQSMVAQYCGAETDVSFFLNEMKISAEKGFLE